ncbi:MAG TPA: aspartate kinase, partial [Bacteroidales bacterium]|nr:aspartate kinase [Bacteroidales bacterium]
MVVYKFGGASVKDSNGVRNLANIVLGNNENRIIVVSAIGKTTNALEEIVKYPVSNSGLCKSKLDNLYKLHLEIVDNLFDDKNNGIFTDLKNDFEKLQSVVFNNSYKSNDQKYDQVVSFGEIISTKIVSAYLNSLKIENTWIDICNVIITDETYREAKVDMYKSGLNCKEIFRFENNSIYITQGFIGKTENGFTTTLGREGSDYTAAILANLLDAEKLIVWKDVEGILNADPQYFSNAKRLDKISYQEAVELAYFGAKVIHPKTLKPLHNKNIPLHVKSFINPAGEGTTIQDYKEYDQNLPIFILKKDQMLISLFPKDLSFVIEDGISQIFTYLSQHGIKVNLVQNSAISISFCIENTYGKIDELLEHLQKEYKVLYNENLELLTVRHYSEKDISEMTKNRKIFIEQRSRHTAHFVVKDIEVKNS